MDIKQLAKKPELIEIIVDDADIVANYGEPVTFYMMDQLDINTYFDFFKSQQNSDSTNLNMLIRKIILNKDGLPVISDDETLPIDIVLAALARINQELGKSKTKPLTQQTGELSN
jgi:hypothetical protein